VLVGCTLLAASSLAVSVARAQDRDEAWVISQIVAGKFDELRSLEALSAQGVPFAMYWWGAMLERCIFERCDKGGARELILRAAVAGRGRAKAHVLGGAETREEFDEIVAKIGIPAGGRERVVYVGRNLLFIQVPRELSGAPRASDAKLRADLLAMAKSELQIGMRAIVAQLQGPTSTDLDVLAETGNDVFSEPLMQRALIRRISDREIIERARAGQLAMEAAYCDSLMIRTGRLTMERGELDVCQRAAQAGFPGAVRGLLTHHHGTRNMPAADYFVGLCDAVLGLRCANAISEYYGDRSKESAELKAKWVFWDLAAANAMTGVYAFGGVSEEELRGKTPELRRELFRLIVRTDLIAEACATRRLDPATGAVEANPQCPWRRSIAIPAEFLSSAK
jgi:hypothetical protein